MEKTKTHKCNWDTIKWERTLTKSRIDLPVYEMGDEVLTRRGKCCECGKTFREVYLWSCVLDDSTNEEADLTPEDDDFRAE